MRVASRPMPGQNALQVLDILGDGGAALGMAEEFTHVVMHIIVLLRGAIFVGGLFDDVETE